MTLEELQAENERLRELNEQLAQIAAGVQTKLEEGARELMHNGWNMCVVAATTLRPDDRELGEYLAFVNPFTKPADHAG